MGEGPLHQLQRLQRGRPAGIRARPCHQHRLHGRARQILSGGLSLIDVMQRKKHRAGEIGSCFVPVRDLFPNVT